MRVRRILGVTFLTVAVVVAMPAAAGEARATFTVGARVIRSAGVRVEALAPVPGKAVDRVRVAARVPTDAVSAAGVTVAPRGEAGAVRAVAAATGTDIALAPADPSSVIVVTLLPDGGPPTIRFMD